MKKLFLMLGIFSMLLLAEKPQEFKQAPLRVAGQAFLATEVDPHVIGRHVDTYSIKYVWTPVSSTDTYDLIFMCGNGYVIREVFNLTTPEWTLIPSGPDLSNGSWIWDFNYDNPAYDYDSEYYQFVVVGYTNGAIQPSYYSETTRMEVPDPVYGDNALPEFYRDDFPEQYFFDEKIGTHTQGYLNYIDGESIRGEDEDSQFTSRRLRTATIDHQYIVMSPRRANAGLAYYEVDFDFSFHALEVELALWSSEEYMRASDCSARLQVKYRGDGAWHTVIDLLNDVELPVGKDNLQPFFFEFDHQSIQYMSDEGEAVRIIMTAPAIGSKNKGRLVVGDINVFQHL